MSFLILLNYLIIRKVERSEEETLSNGIIDLKIVLFYFALCQK